MVVVRNLYFNSGRHENQGCSNRNMNHAELEACPFLPVLGGLLRLRSLESGITEIYLVNFGIVERGRYVAQDV